MSQLELLAKALEYVEQHITEDIHTDDIARSCYCSRSSLEKIFRYVNHISVREYIIRRRMTLAGRILVDNPSLSVLDVAVMFGYSSNEAFTRVFRRVWNKLPSEHRNTRAPDLYPRLAAPMETGEYKMKFDVSELYDLFKSRNDCWFVCTDIVGLIQINEISRDAGDLAILESLSRLERVAGPSDLVLRIGSDEFVILTDSPSEDNARSLLDQIFELNGQPINYNGQDIPLSLYGCIVKPDGPFKRYDDLFSGLIEAIMTTAKAPKFGNAHD